MTPSPEVISIGTVALALIGLAWKMWQDHSKITLKVSDAFERNAVAGERLAESQRQTTIAVQANTEATVASANATKRLEDIFTKTLIEGFKK